jgi:hypothetical protein
VQGKSNRGKGLRFHPLRLHRNSRKLCGVSEITRKDGDFPLRPSQSYKFKIFCAELEGENDRYLEFRAQYVREFPVRVINFSDPADVARHDRMLELVQSMLDLHKLASAGTDHDKTLLARLIEATDRQIDRLVYKLYDLTEEEIGIVENGLNREKANL